MSKYLKPSTCSEINPKSLYTGINKKVLNKLMVRMSEISNNEKYSAIRSIEKIDEQQ